MMMFRRTASLGIRAHSLQTRTLAISRSPSALTSIPKETQGSLTTSIRSVEDAVQDILYSFPEKKETKRHILSVLVDNEPGVLSKVAGLLSARGFNIESLSVSKTDVSDLSRMTVILNCPDAQMDQAHRQLEDLVNVWGVLELKAETAIERELLMCKLDCVPPTTGTVDMNTSALLQRHARRQAIAEIVAMYGGKVINVGTEHVVVEVVAASKGVDVIMELLRPFGIIEAVRSGALAMSQSKVSGIYDDNAPTADRQVVDDSALPPG